MADENPFAVPATSDVAQSSEPRLSTLEQIAVFVVTFVAVVATFFATCFGSVMLGDLMDSNFKSSSGVTILIGLTLIIGLPLLSSAWVLSTVRRVMANALLEKKRAAMKKDDPGSSTP